MKAERFSPTQFRVYETQEEYDLVIDLCDAGHRSVYFEIGGGSFQTLRGDFKVDFLTARDLDDYDFTLGKLEIDPNKNYIEVGAGLSELSYKNPGITIIDPANYELTLKMLEVANSLNVGGLIGERIKTTIKRNKHILSKNANLVNLSLKRAIEKHPGLRGSADVVIDNFGSLIFNSDKEWCKSDLESLLRPGGKLLLPGF